MNRVLSYVATERQRRRKARLKRARRYIRYAADYLHKLMSEFDASSEGKRRLLANGVVGLLQEARKQVIKCQVVYPSQNRLE